MRLVASGNACQGAHIRRAARSARTAITGRIRAAFIKSTAEYGSRPPRALAHALRQAVGQLVFRLAWQLRRGQHSPDASSGGAGDQGRCLWHNRHLPPRLAEHGAPAVRGCRRRYRPVRRSWAVSRRALAADLRWQRFGCLPPACTRTQSWPVSGHSSRHMPSSWKLREPPAGGLVLVAYTARGTWTGH